MSGSSVREYARYHGLASEHRSDDVIQELLNVYNLNNHNNHNAPTKEPTPPLYPDFSTFTPPFEESKLQLGRAGGEFLASCVRPPSFAVQWDKYLPDPHRKRKLKLEVPLLATDHEEDVAAFKRDSTATSKFEEEWDDIQAGRELDAVWKEVETEKIHTTKEVLRNLSQALRDGPMEDAMKRIYERELPSIKKHQVQPPTPLLMAKDPRPELVIPLSSELEFGLFSEDNNILDDLLEHVEHEMQCSGDILPEPRDLSLETVSRFPSIPCIAPGIRFEETSRLEDINPFEVGYSLAKHQSQDELMLETSHEENEVPQRANTPGKSNSVDIAADVEESPRPFFCSDGAQLEVQQENAQPIVPFVGENIFSFSNPGIAIAPDEFVEEVVQRQRKLQSPLDGPFHESNIMPEADLFEEEIDSGLMKFVDAAVQEADDALKQESVFSSKCSLKVEVPKLPPVESMRSFRPLSRDEMISKSLQELSLDSSWSTKGLESEKKMNWVPFKSHLTRLNLDETIEDHSESLLKFISPPADIVQSSQLLFKEPGLRILDPDEYSEDELEEDGDLANLLSKPVEPQIPQKRPVIDDLLASLPLKRGSTPIKHGACETKLNTGQLKVPSGGGFSACNALETFLDLRGKKFKRMASPPARISAVEISDDPIQTQMQDNRVSSVSQNLVETDHSLTSTVSIIQVPATPVKNSTHERKETGVPELKPLSWRRSIMVETAMLKTHRSLFAFLERRGSGKLDIIYRDMSSDQSNSSTRTATPEIILNPMACLIFTNLQALGQKSLPGQNSTSSANFVRSRVQTLAQVYDYVFIIATIPRMVGGFPQNHADAISTFTGYCASFRLASVTAVWVSPTSGTAKTDEALHAWTWSLISQHAFPTTHVDLSTRAQPGLVTLIHEETSWEHFLRKVGMNPMAAQVVLGMLHKSSAAEEECVEKTWGLSRFVRMSAVERISMFAPVVGKKVIERMNAVLDSEWIEGERTEERIDR